MIPRWLASVLVVAFVLLTVWASYNLSSELSVKQSVSPPTPTLTYEGSGSYFYVATLAPNDLYNSTTISGTNVTLFAPITRWINVTFVDGITFDSPAASQLVDHFAVTLSTPAWSKVIEQGVQQDASANSTSFAIVDRYSLNVSGIQNLTQVIDRQLGYYPSQFTVTLAPTVTGEITLAGAKAPVELDPFLNLTFAAALITPNGLPASYHGSILPPGGSADSSNGGAVTDAYLFLAVSVAALAVSLGLLWASRRGAKSSTLPDLDTLIEPYEEVIVRTTELPGVPTILPVEGWEDLVKVADTLGRPILRPSNGPEGASFYVVDGSVAYHYGYPPIRTHGARNPAPSGQSAGRDLDPRTGSSARITAPTETTKTPSAPAGVSSTPALDWARITAEQLKSDLTRIQRATLGPAARAKVLDLVRATAQRVRSASPSEAQHILEEFHRALEDYLREPLSSG